MNSMEKVPRVFDICLLRSLTIAEMCYLQSRLCSLCTAFARLVNFMDPDGLLPEHRPLQMKLHCLCNGLLCSTPRHQLLAISFLHSFHSIQLFSNYAAGGL